MSRYLIVWRLDPDRVPVDPRERAAGWNALMAMVKKDLEKGIYREWGVFLGEARGYAIAEATEIDLSINTQQYYPYVHFEVHAIASVSQIDDMLRALGG